jgi:hypothetical protein
VGNVTLPTPVFAAGGALCLLAGYLAGSIVTSGAADSATATVVSYDASTSRLCLEGDTVKEQKGADADGRLCGTLRHTPNSEAPAKGDDFRFFSTRTTGKVGGKTEQQIVIYGDVAD